MILVVCSHFSQVRLAVYQFVNQVIKAACPSNSVVINPYTIHINSL
jgi:hypothetical protein